MVDLISKRNKLWKRFRDSLKIRNISNLYFHCTEQPPQYWCCPPRYWRYPPTVLNTLHSTDVNPHCTDFISRMHWCYPPLYWTTSTVLWRLFSTVGATLLPQYWCYPPDVPNNLHSTELTLYGVKLLHAKLFIVKLRWTVVTLESGN